MRGTQKLEGVPYEWPGWGTRYLGSQRLHASATETEAHVAQKQAQDKEKRSHLQQAKSDMLLATTVQPFRTQELQIGCGAHARSC